MFRPMKNMDRLDDSMRRLAFPVSRCVVCSPERTRVQLFDFQGIDKEAFLECIKALLRVDKKWIPKGDGYSLYIRPTAISTHPFLGVNAPNSIKLFVINSPVGESWSIVFPCCESESCVAQVLTTPLVSSL